MSSPDHDAAEVAPTQSARNAPAAVGSRAQTHRARIGIWPFLITAVTVAVAALLGWQGWQAYMGTPWTRDGTVRAYVVKIAPQVAGEIVKLPVADNQFVHKGDLLMLIDPTSYAIAAKQAEAAVDQARAVADNARAESARRQELNTLAVTVEEQQTYASRSLSAEAQYQLAIASLQNARVNLERTQILSPVNGYVTNLQARTGDYANVGELQVSVIDADSFWVDAYFEETFLGTIHEGEVAKVKLMGYRQIFRGRVEGIARGINVPNATPNGSGLASVNPIFAFVRLAQRVPVRIQLEDVPNDVRLVAGMTATVEIESGHDAVAARSSAPTAGDDMREATANGSAPATPGSNSDAGSPAVVVTIDRTQAAIDRLPQANSTGKSAGSSSASDRQADRVGAGTARGSKSPTAESASDAAAPDSKIMDKPHERSAAEDASTRSGLRRADRLDQRLIGAWAPSASDCGDVFESLAGSLTFRRPINTFISAFIVGERDIRGVNGMCRIGQVSSMEGYLRIRLDCIDAIGFLPIDARIKILSDTQISYGDVSNDPSIDATYEKCSR